MLKEGWDVTNIYTIVPIRPSASEILTNKPLAAGYARHMRTKKHVDRIMIVAYDNYARVIEGARNSKLISSQPTNIESVSSEDTKVVKEVIEVQSAIVVSIQEKIKKSPAIMKEIEAQAAKAVSSVISEDTPKDVKAATIQNKAEEIVENLVKQEVSRMSFAVYHKQGTIEPWPEGTLFNSLSDPAKKELEDIRRISGQTIEVRNIPIPRLMLTPHYGELVIKDFDLITSRLSKYSTDTSILEERLQGSQAKDLFGNIQEGARESEVTRVSSLGEGRKQSPENTIISALVEKPPARL